LDFSFQTLFVIVVLFPAASGVVAPARRQLQALEFTLVNAWGYVRFLRADFAAAAAHDAVGIAGALEERRWRY
jgi:hypothetical protein